VSWAKKQDYLLVQASIPFTGAEFMVISLGMAGLGALLLMMTIGGIAGFIIGAAVGFYIPTIIVKSKIKQKQKLVNEQLPATLTLMANSLRSGYSYMQAIDLVSMEMPYPIGEEFGIIIKEINLGISTEDAFTNLVKRVNTEDLDLVVTAFLIQRQVGGNLAELLDTIAQTIRERVTMKQKIGALTAQGKISAIVLCMLPIAMGLFLYIINPEYLLSFINHIIGKLAIGAGLVLMGIGIVWMQKIVDIDV
jgi:tight adherence protein B